LGSRGAAKKRLMSLRPNNSRCEGERGRGRNSSQNVRATSGYGKVGLKEYKKAREVSTDYAAGRRAKEGGKA